MGRSVISMEQFNAEYARLTGRVSAADAQRLSGISVDFPIVRQLNKLDPFSPEYREQVLRCQAMLRQSNTPYDPQRDESANSEHFITHNIYADVLPWVMKDVKYTHEFLLSWGQIFKALDLKDTGSVLEYGPGSGQILLMLARCGIDAYGVDIEQRWLDQIKQQADAMNLHIHLERNVFGQGFAGQRFDRILFFEAFHHALDFLDVLKTLRDRLNPGGAIVFSGEPIMKSPTPAVPFPWGPRVDALSLLCTRRYGWMELGFTHDFFVKALMRTGYSVVYHPFKSCGRAVCYVARPSNSPTYSTAHIGKRTLRTLFEFLRGE